MFASASKRNGTPFVSSGVGQPIMSAVRSHASHTPHDFMENKMESVIIMTIGLLTVFTIDTVQKRRKDTGRGKK